MWVPGRRRGALTDAAAGSALGYLRTRMCPPPLLGRRGHNSRCLGSKVPSDWGFKFLHVPCKAVALMMLPWCVSPDLEGLLLLLSSSLAIANLPSQLS